MGFRSYSVGIGPSLSVLEVPWQVLPFFRLAIRNQRKHMTKWS